MRIIGGKYRSRVLVEFNGKDVRPTADRTKESLFNILSVKRQTSETFCVRLEVNGRVHATFRADSSSPFQLISVLQALQGVCSALKMRRFHIKIQT